MLCYITYVMLFYITSVMLCYITYVMLCYITCVVLCYVTNPTKTCPTVNKLTFTAFSLFFVRLKPQPHGKH